MCRVDDAERVNVLSDTHRRARKEHRCDECGRAISVGELYYRESFLFEGQFSVHKTCAHCEIGREWLSRECGGHIYGEVQEELREHWPEGDHYRTRELARLIYGMHRQWQLRRGGLMPLPALTQSDAVSGGNHE